MPAELRENRDSGNKQREHFNRTPNEWHVTSTGETLPHLCWTTNRENIANPANRDYLMRFYRDRFPTLPVPSEGDLKPALFNAITLSLQATGSPYLKDWLTERTTAQTLREYRYPFVDEHIGIQAGTSSITILYFLSSNHFESYRQLHDKALSLLKTAEDTLSATVREADCRLLSEAMARGIPVRRYALSMPLYQFGYGCRQKRLWKGYTSNTSHVGTLVATNKHVANEVLRTYGFPVPDQRTATTVQEATTAAQKIGYPVVVKPTSTDYGTAVSTNIANDSELIAAYRLAQPHGRTIIERHIEGHDYRLTVVDGRCISVLRRDPAQVEGDGVSDIETLMKIVDAERLRDKSLRNYPLPSVDDPLVAETLQKQGLTGRSIPEKGRTVLLRTNANVSTGGRYRNVTAETHPENLTLAERIADSVGLDHAGIDFITPDIARPWHEVECGVCEVNPTPGVVVTPHFDALLEYLAPEGKLGRIPIVALIGDGPEADSAFDRILDLAKSKAVVIGSARRGMARVGANLVTKAAKSTNELFDTLVADISVEFVLLQISPSELLEKGLRALYLDVVGYFATDDVVERIARSPVSMASQAQASLVRPGAGELVELVGSRLLPA